MKTKQEIQKEMENVREFLKNVLMAWNHGPKIGP